MDRAIHYHVFGTLGRPVPHETRLLVEAMQAEMNRRFNWTGNGKIDLKFFDEADPTGEIGGLHPMRVRWGTGSTIVGDDDWNVVLILRFMRWVSTLLQPCEFVRVHDDGSYLVPTYAFFEHGELRVDDPAVDAYFDEVRERGGEFDGAFALRARRDEGIRGNWFRPVLASDFASRHLRLRELEARLAPEEFSKLTLEDAADHTTFPWDEQQQAAA